MFIPPKNFQQTKTEQASNSAKVGLKSSHLLLNHEIVSEVFENNFNVYVDFNAEENTLSLTSQLDEQTKKDKKPPLLMLKDKNIQGDKSIALHEILIDNQLDDSDRELNYELMKEPKRLLVKL